MATMAKLVTFYKVDVLVWWRPECGIAGVGMVVAWVGGGDGERQ